MSIEVTVKPDVTETEIAQAKEEAKEKSGLNTVRYVMDIFPEPISWSRLQFEIATDWTDGDYRLAAGLILLAEEKGVIEQSDDGYVLRRQTTPSLLTKPTARDWCGDMMCQAIQRRLDVLLEAIPSVGKSTNVPEIAGKIDRPIVYLSHRHEPRGDLEDRAEEEGLDHYRLPRFEDQCPTAAGEHGEDIKQTVLEHRDSGVPPSRIHEHFDLECHSDGACPYLAAWDFEGDELDIIIGHPLHAYNPDLIAGRAVIFDEDTGDSYETRLEGDNLRAVVNAFLQQCPEIEAQSRDGLRSMREHDEKRTEALRHLDEQRLIDTTFALEEEDGHPFAPAAVYALLEGEDLGNGFERTGFADGSIAVYNTNHESLTIRRPPDLSPAASILALDGTPVHEQWENRLGTDLTHWRVLSDEERREYVQDVLGYTVIQTTENEKPYSSGIHVKTEKDTALLKAIYQKHDEKPSIITSSRAEDQLLGTGNRANEFVKDSRHFNNFRSSNVFENCTLGVVLGSPNHGDDKVKRLAALDGYAVERESGTFEPLSFGQEGDRYLRYIREYGVAQAAFRFGRRGQGATIYIHTAAVPDWLVTDQAEGVADQSRAESKQEIMSILQELGTATSPEIEAEMEMDITGSQIREHLRNLEDEGVVEKEGKTKGAKWHDDGIADAPRTARVDLSI